GFASAAGALGVNPQLLLLQGEVTSLATTIIQANPDIAVIYGSPALASELYNILRESDWTGRFAYEQIMDETFRSIVPFEQLNGILSTLTWPFTAVDPVSDAFLGDFVRSF